jgi:chromosome partitioning protein
MPVVIAFVSQKGGVFKSTLARLIAREYANSGWSVKIADLNVGQGTSFHWQGRRLLNEIQPIVPVERFGSIEQALELTASLDLLVIDAPPNSNASTLRITQASDAVILPTGLSLDDMQPAVLLAYELVKKGVPKTKIAFALSRRRQSPRNHRGSALHQRFWLRFYLAICPRRSVTDAHPMPDLQPPRPGFLLNERADKPAQSISDLVAKLQRTKVA